jgi:putative redox protein
MKSVTVTSLDGIAERITAGGHDIIADEPEPIGADRGPDPYSLLMGALGACTAMTLRLYAGRKEWPLEGVEVRLRTDRNHAEDCLSGGRCEVIHVEIDLQGPLSAEQRERLLEIATRCPVSRTLRDLEVRHAPRDATSDSSASSQAP